METDDTTATEAGGDIVVFSILKPSVCAECGEELWKGSFLRMEKEKPLCFECADLDHLVFLPRGDVALTRRSRKYSTLSAVVVRFSRSRKRYERQGLLVESGALERAQEECLSDEAKRQVAREKASLAREQADIQYVAQFVDSVRSRYPDCPAGEAQAIAKHACEKYSRRVGRSAAAKSFDATAIDLAVKAQRSSYAHRVRSATLAGLGTVGGAVGGVGASGGNHGTVEPTMTARIRAPSPVLSRRGRGSQASLSVKIV